MDDAVNTAIAQTQQAQALAQATVNAAALTAIPTPIPATMPSAAPATPTPGPTVEYITLTEEELAALIDEAAAEAVTATEQTTTAVTTTTSDDVVTPEEVEYMYDYYYLADYYVQYTEELLNEYYSLYGELAEEMLVTLTIVEGELEQMNDTLTSIDSSLQEMSSTLEQGLAVAQETITQLETAAQAAQTHAQELKAQQQNMMSQLQLDQEHRVQDIAQVQPDNIPTDRISSLQTAFDFLDTAKQALGDNKLSHAELMNIAQLGANAQAGFQNFGGSGGLAGGPDLSQLTGNFNQITGQLANGQMPQARGNLDTFERSLGDRPGRRR